MDSTRSIFWWILLPSFWLKAARAAVWFLMAWQVGRRAEVSIGTIGSGKSVLTVFSRRIARCLVPLCIISCTWLCSGTQRDEIQEHKVSVLQGSQSAGMCLYWNHESDCPNHELFGMSFAWDDVKDRFLKIKVTLLSFSFLVPHLIHFQQLSNLKCSGRKCAVLPCRAAPSRTGQA